MREANFSYEIMNYVCPECGEIHKNAKFIKEKRTSEYGYKITKQCNKCKTEYTYSE